MKTAVSDLQAPLWAIAFAIFFHACMSMGNKDVYIQNWPLEVPCSAR